MAKKIVYVDMDNTIVDFKSGIKRLPKLDIKEYNGREDEHPHIFTLMDPIKDSIESVKELTKNMIYMSYLQHLGKMRMLGNKKEIGLASTLAMERKIYFIKR